MNMFKSLCFAASVICLPMSAANAQTYASTNDYTNISKALFKTGVLRANDPAAIDEYLRISHCGLFEQYGGNDIAWTRIRESQGIDLTTKIPSFSEYVEVEGELKLGSYDPLKGGFTFNPINAYENLSYINVIEINGGNLDICKDRRYRTFVPRVHPLRLRARLQDPIDIRFIPIAQEQADALLQQLAARPDRYIGDEKRSVVMVMRMKLGGADPLSSSSNDNSTNILAQLDEFLVYDGPERNKIIMRRDFKKPTP